MNETRDAVKDRADLEDKARGQGVHRTAAIALHYMDLSEQLRGEVDRLRAAGQAVLSRAYLDDDVINRHSSTTVSCEALRQLRDALQPPNTKERIEA